MMDSGPAQHRQNARASIANPAMQCAYFCKECGVRMCQHCLTRHPQEHTIIQVESSQLTNCCRSQKT